MKMIIKTLSICILLALGCKNPKQKSAEVSQQIEIIKIPKITTSKGNNSIKLSTIIDSVFTVRLETTQESIIGSIMKVLVHNNSIYIFDTYKSKAVFEFTMAGKFVRKFGNQGKGPGEYIGLRDFTIDPKEEVLILYDRAKRRLLKYDLEGTFISATKIRGAFSEFTLTDTGYVGNVHNIGQGKKDKERPFALIFWDKEGKVESRILNAKHKIGNLISTGNLKSSEQGIFYKEAYGDKIYKVHKDTIVPVYQIEFEDQKIPEELFEKVKNSSEFLKRISEKEYARIISYNVVDDVILFHILKGTRSMTYLYSMATKKVYTKPTILDETTIGLGLSGQQVGYQNDYAISFMQPGSIRNMANFMKNSPNTQKLASEVAMEDNPVLIFSKIKEGI